MLHAADLHAIILAEQSRFEHVVSYPRDRPEAVNSSEMGNVVSGAKKDQYIEDPEVIDGPDPDGHTSPGE